MLLASCSTAAVIRRHVNAPSRSPSAASSWARVLLSSNAFSPQRLSIRLAARQISISGITRVNCRLAVEKRLTSTIAWLESLPVKVGGYMAAILTAEDVVRRIAAECAYVDERG